MGSKCFIAQKLVRQQTGRLSACGHSHRGSPEAGQTKVYNNLPKSSSQAASVRSSKHALLRRGTLASPALRVLYGPPSTGTCPSSLQYPRDIAKPGGPSQHRAAWRLSQGGGNVSIPAARSSTKDVCPPRSDLRPLLGRVSLLGHVILRWTCLGQTRSGNLYRAHSLQVLWGAPFVGVVRAR